ncbi:MAG: hypothetical protein ACXAD7_10950 [Candidatus Kariarchaeaceae archaeon]|jgi:hypothetical protein
METVETGLPLDWHGDGIPIFLRGDFIRDPRPLEPNGFIYDNLILPEHKHLRPELRFNMIRIPAMQNQESTNAVWLGKSYPDAKRGFVFGRVIQALDQNCRIILQRWVEPGVVTDYVMLTMQALQLSLVSPVYECILVNASPEFPARFFELQSTEEVRNIDDIKSLNGPGYILEPNGGFLPNQNYSELPIPRIHPGHDHFRFMQRRPLYEMLTSYPKGFDFIDPPRDEFFIGAV